MHHFYETITNTFGDSLVGYYARVIDPATQSAVPIFGDNNGTPIMATSLTANMAMTDDYGNLSFYVEPGTYHLDLYGKDATTFIRRVPNVAMNSGKGDKGDRGEPGETGVYDPWGPTMDSVARKAFNRITFSAGVRTVTQVPIVVAEFGNSHGNALGASSFALSPGNQFRAALQTQQPNRQVQLDQYSVNGSWAVQINGQMDGITRTPNIAVLNVGTNDGIANIFMGYQGYVGPNNTKGGYETALEDVIRRFQAMGTQVIVVNDPLPHPFRSLNNNRFQVTPEVLMTWPVTSMIAFFLRIVFTRADQRISAYAVNGAGQYVPFDLFNQFGNGLLAVGSSLLEFKPNDGTYNGATHTIAEIDPNGAWVRVNGTIMADRDDPTFSIRQNAFDNETQVYPPTSQALVQRDLSGTGALVTTSWRHWEIAMLTRRVATRNGAVVVDHAAILGKLITSDSAWDAIYNNGDDFHLPDAGYLQPQPQYQKIARDLSLGIPPTSLVYGPA